MTLTHSEPGPRVTQIVPPLLLGILALAIRLPLLGDQGLWFDEAYTYFIAELPIKTAIEALLIDGVHPPAYYLLMRAMILLGRQEALLRVPSVVFGAVLVPLLYLVVSRQFGRRAGYLAGGLLLLSPFHLWHSRDARMYSMLALLATFAMQAYLRIWSEEARRWRAAFILFSGLAYITHYFAFVLPFIQFIHLALFIKRKPAFIRTWIALQVVASIPALIWIGLLAARAGQSFGIGWIPGPEMMDLIYSLINLTVAFSSQGNWLQNTAFAVTLAALVAGTIALWKRADKGMIWLLWGYLPLLLIFVLSLRRPLYIDRFFILSIPAILTVVAVGVARLPGKIFSAAAALLMALFAVRSVQFLRDPAQQKEAWREAAHVLAEATPGETIVFRVLQIAVPFRYYPPGAAEQQSMEVNRTITPLPELAEGFKAMWLVYWNANGDVHLPAGNLPFDVAADQDSQALKWTTGQGPPIIERFDLKGITIFRFDLETLEPAMSS